MSLLTNAKSVIGMKNKTKRKYTVALLGNKDQTSNRLKVENVYSKMSKK